MDNVSQNLRVIQYLSMNVFQRPNYIGMQCVLKMEYFVIMKLTNIYVQCPLNKSETVHVNEVRIFLDIITVWAVFVNC